MVLGMLFLFFSNANLQFDIKKLTGRPYTIAKAFITIKKVEFIAKHKFA